METFWREKYFWTNHFILALMKWLTCQRFHALQKITDSPNYKSVSTFGACLKSKQVQASHLLDKKTAAERREQIVGNFYRHFWLADFAGNVCRAIKVRTYLCIWDTSWTDSTFCVTHTLGIICKVDLHRADNQYDDKYRALSPSGIQHYLWQGKISCAAFR